MSWHLPRRGFRFALLLSLVLGLAACATKGDHGPGAAAGQADNQANTGAETGAETLITPQGKAEPVQTTPGRTMAEILQASPASDWRTPNPAHTLYLELDGGRVVFELNPQLAPKHVENVLKIVRSGYFHGLPIYRVQDNFVAQWGDAEGKRPLLDGVKTLPAEFMADLAQLRPTVLPDPDGFAPQTGFLDGFPVGIDSAQGKVWPAHCYGVLGVGRDNAADSGGGTELYVVIGHAPRQLDRNITVIGRVIDGMERLSALARGAPPMGMIAERDRQATIREVRVAADVASDQQSRLELLRTDSASFVELIEARRNRRDAWYLQPAGHIDLCNVPLPVRVKD